MKILYAAKKYNYGSLVREFSYAHFNFYNTLSKMNNRENEVIYFPFDEIIKKKSKEEINKELLRTVYREKPDLAFFVTNLVDSTLFKRETIKKISQSGKTITLNWFSDDHWQFEKFSKYWAPYFNWVTTTDHQAVKKYYKIGYKNVIETQYAFNHYLFNSSSVENNKKKYDITFVGAVYGNRKKIIEKLKKNGINVNCWGQGSANGRVSQQRMFKIFSQSKINLNFSKCSGSFWKDLALIFFSRKYDRTLNINNPKRWTDNFKSMNSSIKKRVIKGRIFEILGGGGFLLSEYADNLENYYQIDKEIVCYKNFNELVDKIKYYLKNDKERETIREMGFKRTLEEHTYEKRFSDIFKTIKK